MVVLLWIIGVLWAVCNGMPPNTQQVYRNLIDGKGLYDENDRVVIVNATTFKSTIFGRENAWLVEFYNSWCGHCFMFAPKWKALAADTHAWAKVVQLAAIDCSTDENNPTCRDYDVMGYPTVKFFPAHAKDDAPGTELPVAQLGSGSPQELEAALVTILKKEQNEGRGNHWPNLLPLRSNDLGTNLGAEHVFIIFEHPDTNMGAQLVLDMSAIEQVLVRNAYSDNEILARSLGVHIFPALVYIPHGHADGQLLNPSEPTREGFREAMRALLAAKGVNLPPLAPPVVVQEVAQPNMGHLMELHNVRAKLKQIKSQGDVVYLADLETALRYMLTHEVPAKKVIKTEALDALRSFLSVIAKYFPAGEAGIKFLQDLSDAVKPLSEIRGLRFKALVKEGGGLNSVLATEDGYIGCRGSEAHLRGYPCAVWTLFHYLTVSAVRSQDPLEVIGAMLGYITHFFGCTECSLHFQEMANLSMRAKSTDSEKAVLWLWSAHNQVNERLKGAATEDPEFPKIQYPSESQCPKCRDSAGRWSEPQVLHYLRNKYHQDSLNYEAANTRIAVGMRLESLPNNRHLVETVAAAHNDDDTNTNVKYFNFLDFGICLVLYVFSAIICAALFWKFILRRNYRKKAF